MFRVFDTKYRIITLIIIVLIIDVKESECAWNVGCDLSYFPSVGNLSLNNPALEYELFLNYKNSFNAINQLSFSWLHPGINPDSSLSSVDLAAIWLQRGAEFSIWRFKLFPSAGVGLTRVLNKKNHREVMFGSFSFRSDLSVLFWQRKGVNCRAGVSFKGCPFHNTGKVSDRFGFTIIISG